MKPDTGKTTGTTGKTSLSASERGGTAALTARDGVPLAEMALSLEPRFMFDAAGLATGVEISADTIAEAQAEAAQQAADAGGHAVAEPGLTGSEDLFAALIDAKPTALVNEIVFVDTSVNHYEVLLAGIHPGAEVVLLDSARDGLAQIAEVLDGRTGISAIHIISHGDSGQLQLGNTTLSQDSMQNDFAAELAVIGNAMDESGDLLIYGCNFAEGEQGRLAVDMLAKLTGADVAASTDLSGHSSLAADWDLEHQTGTIETANVIPEITQSQWRGLLIDTDGDTVDNATDIDDDNDGILDTDEGFQVMVTFTSDPIDLADGPDTTNVTINLSGTGLEVGDTVTVSNVLANGDLDAGTETFSIEFNKGTASAQFFGGLQTDEQFTGSIPLVVGINATVEVIDVSGNPSITIEAVSPAAVDDFVGLGYGVRFTVDIAYVQNADTDGDGIDDYLDIDSDNDGITDNVEAQTTQGNIQPSGIAAGITDANGDGLDDNYDSGALGASGGIGLTPIDSDSDGAADLVDQDADGDGIDDIAERGDGQPVTLTSLTDTDGDGLLDIFEGGTTSDADVNDDNLIFTTTFNLADSDDDLAADGSDALGSLRNLDFRENNLLDIDEDGIANADDIDADNDGILNIDEGAPAAMAVLVTTSLFEVAAGPTTDNFVVDLSGTGLAIGDTVTVSNVQANGDLDGAGELFSLVFNSGEKSSGELATGQQFGGLTALTNPISIDVTVIDLGMGVPGINVSASAPSQVDDLGFGYGVQFRFDITGSIQPTQDSDGDGVPDHLDIDSDNDGITDNVEAQTTAAYIAPSGTGLGITDSNSDGLDDSYDPGALGVSGGIGLSLTDSDGDLINDILDADSDSDGVGDIAERRDGAATTITSFADSDGDGLLDIFEGGNLNDLDVNDENLTGSDFNLADSDDDIAADGNDATPPTADLDFREGDSDNDGILNANDIDADNDGVLNTDEGQVTAVVNSPNIDLGDGPDSTSVNIDLSGTTLSIGDIVTITNVQANGDLDSGVEVFTLNFNSGQRSDTGLQTGLQYGGFASVGLPDFDLTVIDIGGGTPGINVVATSPGDVDQFGGNPFGVRVIFDISYQATQDSDGDGIADHLDIDSDNDGITDNVEAQTTAAYVAPSGIGSGITDDNSDGLDDNYDPGALGVGGGIGLSLTDTDSDLINDILDADSDADGAADIRERGDGQPMTLTNLTDSDGDGLLDIFEGGTIIDADVNDENLIGADFNLSDSDDDTDADGTNATPLTQDLDFRDDLRDIDGDSIPNVSDADADGDGIANTDEGFPASDADGDGIADWLDIDSDNDGITDNVEAQRTQDYQPPSGMDTDGDGIDNTYDVGATGINPVDTDGDLTDDVYDTDSDNDGIDDIAERGDGQPRSLLSTADADSDGLVDIFEGSSTTDIDANDENLTGANFNLADTDADTAADGTDAVGLSMDLDFRDLADTDNDGVPNSIDIDADNDGILNINEGLLTDTDSDGVFDYLDLDSDNDGLSDLFESGAAASIINADTNFDGAISVAEAAAALSPSPGDNDGDGLMDVFDLAPSNPLALVSIGTLAVDTDLDLKANYLDLDSDNDGIADTIEGRATSGYVSNDGDVRDDDMDGDGVIALFDTNDATTGIFGGSFTNVAIDTDGDLVPDYLDTNSDDDLAAGNDSVESGFTFSGVDLDLNGIDDNASIGVSYADPDGTTNNPATDLPNQFGDTSEVAYREGAFSATADVADGEVNESAGAILTLNVLANDIFDNANVALTVSVASVTSSTSGTTAVPAMGSVQVTTDLGGLVTIHSDGTVEYDPNNQAVFSNLNFGDDPVIDSFSYTSTFNGVTTSSTTVNISVGPNNEFELSSLVGSNGTVFNGAAADDQAGFKVEDVGDLNGDGYDDFAITAVTASPNGNYSGQTYVLFGKAGGFGPSFELSTLAAGNGTNGFVLNGVADGDLSGRSLSAGDINGDGFSDLIVSASRADYNGDASGDVYVLFGRADFSTLLAGGGVYEFADLTPGGTDGFVLRGIEANDNLGRSVAFAGDVNGDGIGDLIVSSHFANPNGAYSGETYLIFGRTDFSPVLTSGVFEMSSLAGGSGVNGTVFNGVAAGDFSGNFVAGAGDFNGDGLQDIVIGAHYADSYAGAAYVVYGQLGGFGVGEFELSSLNGTNGFALTGAAGNYAGTAVGVAGDINGDGFDDVIVSAPGASPNGLDFSGTTYIVFGQSAALAATQALTAVADVTVNGALYAYHTSGFSLESAGDINGDGFDDLLLGRGPFYGVDAGAVYVVFGSASLGATLELSTLVPVSPSTTGGTAGATITDGFVLSGVDFDDYAGQAVSVAGDVNGDGFADLIIGAYSAAPNGGYSGEAYLVYGTDFRDDAPVLGTTGGDALIGSTSDEVLNGGDGNDILEGAGGNDVLLGGNGDDTLIYDPADVQRVDGGGGTDTLDFTDSSGVLLDLTSINNNVYRDIEVIDLTGAGNNTLRLSTLDLLALSGSSNVLTVNGNTGDAVQLSDFGSWTFLGLNGAYNEYSNGEALIRVLNGVPVSAAVGDDLQLLQGQDETLLAASEVLLESRALASGSDHASSDVNTAQGVVPFTHQLSLATDHFDSRAQNLLNALLVG